METRQITEMIAIKVVESTPVKPATGEEILRGLPSNSISAFLASSQITSL